MLWGTNCSKLSAYNKTSNMTSSSFVSDGSLERMVVCDMNGDGLLDIVIVSSKGYTVMKNKGTIGNSKFSSFTSSSSDYHTDMCFNHSEGNAFVCGDFNGDGLCDFFKGTTSSNSVYFGNVDCTFKKRDFSNIVQCAKTTQAYSADIDGDGKSELVIVRDDGRSVSMYHYSGSLFTLMASQQNDKRRLSCSNITIGDCDMDGKLEIITFGASLLGNEVNECGIFTVKNASSVDAGLVKTIASPYKSHTIHYTNLLDNGVYNMNKTYAESSNLLVLKMPLKIVSSYDEHNKNAKMGSYTTVSYKYENLVAQVTGKGLLVFTQIRERNSGLRIEKVVDNTVGSSIAVLYPSKISTKAWNGTSITEVSNIYSIESFGANSRGCRLLLTKSIGRDMLNSNTCTTTYATFKFGRPTVTTINKGEVTNKVQYKDFLGNDAYNIFLPQTKVETNGNTKGSVSYTTKYSYDERFRLVKVIDLYGSEKSRTTSFSYTRKGNLLSKQLSASGCETQITSYDYTGSGRFLCYEKRPDGSETRFSWNEEYGRLIKTTSSVGSLSYVTSYNTYDGFNNCLKQTMPDGRVLTKKYSIFSDFNPGCYEIKTTLTGSPEQSNVFDADGRLIRKGIVCMDGSVRFSFMQYDAAGRLEYEFYPTRGGSPVGNRFVVHNVYDKFGRITKEEHLDGYTTYSYSQNKVTQSTPIGTTVLEYNMAGQLVKSTVNGKTVSFTYTPTGQVATSTAESSTQNLITSMSYDIAGNRVSINDPDVGLINIDYDNYGREIYRLTEKGRAIRTVYDSRGRVSSIKDGYDDATYSYNDNNQLVKELSKNYSCTFTYDAYNRVTRKSELIANTAFETKYAYANNYGGVSQTTYPSGLVVNNSYNENGYLTNVSCGGKNVWSLSGMDDHGRVIGENLSGGVIKSVKYNEKGQLCQESAYKGTSGLMDLKYTYTGVNITKKEDVLNANIEQYTYDAQNRLEKVITTKAGVSYSGTHAYDELGNMTKTWDGNWNSIAYGQNGLPPHQVSSVSYKNSSVTSAPKITFDSYRMATRIEQGSSVYEIEYRPDHSRCRSVLKKSGKEIDRKYYLNNYEKSINNSGVNREIHYLYGATGLAAIYVRTGGKDTLFTAVNDRQNSLTAVMDVATGKVEKFAYEPWGMRRNPSNWKEDVVSDYPARFSRGYCMHEHMPEFGLINMGGRIFNARTNQFLSPDPYRQAPENWLNCNRFGYCLNNPVMFSDPNGEFVWFVPIIIGAAIGGAINLGVQAYNGKIENVGQGFAAFGWGALAGGAAAGVAVWAGAAVAGTAVASSVSYAFGTGMMATATSSVVLSIGNHCTFGDPMIGGGELLISAFIGGATAGFMQGLSNAILGKNFWTGLSNRTPDFDLMPQKAISETTREVGRSKVNEPANLISDGFPPTTAGQKVVYTIRSDCDNFASVENQVYKISTPKVKFNGYESRIASQSDPFHNFPYSFDEIMMNNGTTILRGNNTYIFQVGSVNGKEGVYTLILNENGYVFHREFLPTNTFIKTFYYNK